MTDRPVINRRIVLTQRPHGAPRATDFRLEEAPAPAPQDGQVLVRAEYLSLDPYMRNLMDEGGTSYARGVALGAPMVGATVGRVVTSRHPHFRQGAWVLGQGGWQDYALSDGTDLVDLGDMPEPSQALGLLGMPAFTAHVGLLDIGQSVAGETVVVAAATGGVGAMVGQIAKIKGARAIGIAGGAAKCRHAIDTLGFDDCLDRHAPDLAERLAAACPAGIDVYFENVGGAVLEAVLPLLNIGARVPVCGFIAHYNDTALPSGPNRLPQLLSAVLQKRVRMQGFIILDHYGARFEAFRRDMTAWIEAGKITQREDRIEGLENAAAAFIGLLEGEHIGKRVVRVAAA